MSKKIKLAYLAPEIPALSATFVYNEILQLEQLGFAIVPFSVHSPVDTAVDEKLSDLNAKVFHLYDQNKLLVLKENIFFLLMHPLRYLSTALLLIADMFKMRIFSRTAIGLIFRYFYSVVLAKQLLEDEVQHLHVHFAHVPADIAMYAASLSGITFSVTAHANDLFERGWLLREKVERADFFITISEYNRQFLHNLGCDTRRVIVVRCGVDVEAFHKSDKSKIPDVPKIGFIGRLVEKKGAADLLFAAHALKERGIPFELLIAGSGPLERQLKDLTRSLELTEREVSFLGAISHSRVADFLGDLDIFVLPCVKDSNGDMDGIPVVLMEAMLTGVPVISTKLSGIPELIVEHETGLLFTPGNRSELAHAIIKLLEDSAVTEQLRLKAIEKVKNDFNMKTNVAQLAALFENALLH